GRSPASGERPAGQEGYTAKSRYVSSNLPAFVRRRAMELAEGNPGPPAPRSTPRVPVLLVEFDDEPGPFPAQDYQRLLFGDPSDPDDARRPTMRNYFRDNSDGRLDLNGQVFGW